MGSNIRIPSYLFCDSESTNFALRGIEFCSGYEHKPNLSLYNLGPPMPKFFLAMSVTRDLVAMSIYCNLY